MEYQKILNLLNKASDSRFVKKVEHYQSINQTQILI